MPFDFTLLLDDVKIENFQNVWLYVPLDFCNFLFSIRLDDFNRFVEVFDIYEVKSTFWVRTIFGEMRQT